MKEKDLSCLGSKKVPPKTRNVLGQNKTRQFWGVILFFKLQNDTLTPSLPQHGKFTARKMHTRGLAKSIFSGPITHLLSVLYVLMEIFSHPGEKKENNKAFFLKQ